MCVLDFLKYTFRRNEEGVNSFRGIASYSRRASLVLSSYQSSLYF